MDPPAAAFENNLVCSVGCFASTESACQSSKVRCTGAENMCIDLTAKQNSVNSSIILKGCGTQSACTLKTNSTLTIGGKSYTVEKAEDCKGATSSSLSVIGHSLQRGVLPLLLPSISSILLTKFLC
ncbi:hypothetical protein JD844_005763 [Phrynosoma platyrhinos]|uniref:Uncharacterized protein n=1 Tax=Phrynosoma platyrhinos TaxID=52577 RepID=A0ABQ7TNP8_PHRPL|nr:hypothetical protein JD844_005763 [Phrynosoma platyrhinos]